MQPKKNHREGKHARKPGRKEHVIPNDSVNRHLKHHFKSKKDRSFKGKTWVRKDQAVGDLQAQLQAEKDNNAILKAEVEMLVQEKAGAAVRAVGINPGQTETGGAELALGDGNTTPPEQVEEVRIDVEPTEVETVILISRASSIYLLVCWLTAIVVTWAQEYCLAHSWNRGWRQVRHSIIVYMVLCIVAPYFISAGVWDGYLYGVLLACIFHDVAIYCYVLLGLHPWVVFILCWMCRSHIWLETYPLDQGERMGDADQRFVDMCFQKRKSRLRLGRYRIVRCCGALREPSRYYHFSMEMGTELLNAVKYHKVYDEELARIKMAGILRSLSYVDVDKYDSLRGVGSEIIPNSLSWARLVNAARHQARDPLLN